MISLTFSWKTSVINYNYPLLLMIMDWAPPFFSTRIPEKKSFFYIWAKLAQPTQFIQHHCFTCDIIVTYLPLVLRDNGVLHKVSRVPVSQWDWIVLPGMFLFCMDWFGLNLCQQQTNFFPEIFLFCLVMMNFIGDYFNKWQLVVLHVQQ